MKIIEENLSIGSLATGENLSLKKFVLDSEKPGKFVYIQGGIHGGEVTLPIIKKLFDFLKSNLICGKIEFVPFANPLAWRQQGYCYTMGKFSFVNGIDFNRCFGKKENGNINCKIANTLLSEAEKADFAIDLHTAMTSEPYSIFSSLSYAKFVKYLNLQFNNYCEPTPEYVNTFDVQLLKKGVDNVVIECGSHDKVEEENITKIFDGIVNLFKHFGIVAGNADDNNNFLYYENATKLYAPVGGIVEFNKKLKSKLSKGDVVCSVTTGDLTKPIVEIKSPCNGILFRVSKTHICDQCAELAYIIDNNSFKSI